MASPKMDILVTLAHLKNVLRTCRGWGYVENIYFTHM